MQIFCPATTTWMQFSRYLVVGTIATVADFGTLVFLMELLYLHYLASNAIGFLVGLITNYVLSVSWVFSSRVLATKWLEFLVFSFIGIVGLGISELAMYVGVGLLTLHYTVAKIAAIGATLVWNFTVRKAALFREVRA